MSPVTTASSGPNITVPETGLLVSSSNFNLLACFFFGLGVGLSEDTFCRGVTLTFIIELEGEETSSSLVFLLGHWGGEGVLGGVIGACIL